MFILNQTRSNSINVDIIDQIVAVPPRMGDEETRPRVIALIGSQEETLAIYSTMEDCRTAVEYVSFLINNNSRKIAMPTQKDMKIVHNAKTVAEIKGGTIPEGVVDKSIAELVADIKKGIEEETAKQFPGGKLK